jgi:FecR protein
MDISATNRIVGTSKPRVDFRRRKGVSPVRSNRHRNDGLIRASVFLLAVCTLAGAHTARAQSNAGTVSSASGEVQIQRGAAIMAAKPGTPVNQGDKIASGAEGVAVIILSDGSQLELSPSTDIMLNQYISGGPTPTRVSLASGVLKSAVKKTPGTPANYQVRTPNAIVTARGTAFYTSYTESSPQTGNLPGVSHYTEVAVVEGTINLAQAAAPDRGVEIAQGTTGTVAGGEAPENHKRKFPTPVPTPTCSSIPTSVDQCKNGGWQQFACFKNQGQCIKFVKHE